MAQKLKKKKKSTFKYFKLFPPKDFQHDTIESNLSCLVCDIEVSADACGAA